MSLRTVFESARTQREFAAGDVVFTAGDAGDEMFGVIAGAVELRHGDDVAATIGEGGTFGEMAIITDSPRSLTAVALEASTIAAINRHTFLFLVTETPTFALDVMRSLVDRIHALER